MIDVAPKERAPLKEFFPDRPGPLAGQHVVRTGLGRCLVDRWPNPRAAIARTGYDIQLAGDADRIDEDALRDLTPVGFIDAGARYRHLLARVFPDAVAWPRVIATLEAAPPPPSVPASIRRLDPKDADALADLEDDIDWICDSLGGPVRAAESQLAFGAFVGADLASVAVPYHLGERFEDIGVVTDSRFRGRGLSPACAAHVAADVRARGRTPSWSTSPDNLASLAVAKKLGARKDRDDVLWVTGTEPPKPATVEKHGEHE